MSFKNVQISNTKTKSLIPQISPSLTCHVVSKVWNCTRNILDQEDGISLLPWHWHILSQAGRGISTETCGLNDVFVLMTLVLVHNSINYYILIMYDRFILSNRNKPFLRDIYIPKVGVVMTVCQIMRCCYQPLLGFNCITPSHPLPRISMVSMNYKYNKIKLVAW